ncbi:MAG: hypothetical protein JO052_04485 [Bradyrhizobium sp.]|nr:hypothetical protein [Bradyrhizobium sp.]
MSMFSTARRNGVVARSKGASALPVALAALAVTASIALVVYLLWPTWGAVGSSEPSRLPISIGGTLFNVPAAAIRMKIQRHSGTQERIDLNFTYPTLDPPDAPRHISEEAIEATLPPIDRLFLSIAAYRDTMAPDMRVRTIYPRYLEQVSTPGADGLTMRAFREQTPYAGEDLFFANSPALSARCTRDATTPGMCLSERRIDGADLTFRFPRSWLAQWRDVADAMDRLTVQLHGSKG